MTQRIDVHHHIIPPRWLAEEGKRMSATAVNFDFVAKWTPEKSLESMDRNGVATAVISISTVAITPENPGAAYGLAHDCNEYAARLSHDHPGRFGVFALLPLPHVEECLREIDYCTDVLKVDGFKVQTSYKDTWLGDPAFAPVFDELHRRKAVVFVHPAVPDCCMNMMQGVHPPVIEYPFDTTRTIASLLFSGTYSRCPNVRFIFSHGGGTIPMLAYRMITLAKKNRDLSARLPGNALAQLQKLYFDTPMVTNTPAMSALLALSTASKVLLGSDTPYLQIEETVSELAGLGLGTADLLAIERENALALLPRLARSS
jgi:predicted TIM-barrel fold metal-dependent hydrolase